MGGTITGRGAGPTDALGYTAADLPVEALLEGVELDGVRVTASDVARIDSKDLMPKHMQALVRQLVEDRADGDVDGSAVTHGTDTFSESCMLLHMVFGEGKPIVPTAAMRPNSVPSSDGPGNLLNSIILAASAEASGVLPLMHGKVWHPWGLRKVNTEDLDTFWSEGKLIAPGLAEPGHVASVVNGEVRRHTGGWPVNPRPIDPQIILDRDPETWPTVEIITSHSGATGRYVDFLLSDEHPHGLGIVVAGTGNGTVHDRLGQALLRAMGRKKDPVPVVIASQCSRGWVIPGNAIPGAKYSGELSPEQARIKMQVEMIEAQARRRTLV